MAEFTCPMHPEVVRDAPGSCPICGMALEPRTVTAETEEDHSELDDMTRRFWVATAFSLPLVILAMGVLLVYPAIYFIWKGWRLPEGAGRGDVLEGSDR